MDRFRSFVSVICNMSSKSTLRPMFSGNSRHGSLHNNGVIMSAITSQITGASIVCSTVGAGPDQRKHQSCASLAFVRGIHRWPVNSSRKRPVTRKCFHLMTSSLIYSIDSIVYRPCKANWPPSTMRKNWNYLHNPSAENICIQNTLDRSYYQQAIGRLNG